ncbi:hypothetical protein CLOM_g2482 [Closterium sp. NIES-68]|nr:hypothetical protein CLOM_g2482 [Closterium sp. NIES-68]GJP74326.1 hypothetical protein CLOP_g4923 [Closterium sp. NIES-67]
MFAEAAMPRFAANYAPLTPLAFLERAARVHPESPSVIYGRRRFTWSQTFLRCCQLAAALERAGARKYDRVAVLAPNVPAMYEAQFGVPLTGAVLVSVNARLDAASVARILAHSDSKFLLVDQHLASLALSALSLLPTTASPTHTVHVRPKVVLIADGEEPSSADMADPGGEQADIEGLGAVGEYEEFIASVPFVGPVGGAQLATALAAAAAAAADGGVITSAADDGANGADSGDSVDAFASRPQLLPLVADVANSDWWASHLPQDEQDPIALNYTSGTTSAQPKGVVYSHRGAYLNALSAVLMVQLRTHAVFLLSVPLFHCNAWCFCWSLPSVSGTGVLIRNVTARAIFAAVAERRVEVMVGVPVVLNLMVNAADQDKALLGASRGGRNGESYKDEQPHRVTSRVTVLTGGAPPPAAILAHMEQLGFDVIHSYGLTETYGPAMFCDWKPHWDALPLPKRARIKSRQGVRHIGLQSAAVLDRATLRPVPMDGVTIGEVVFRGNTVMRGYLHGREETQVAFAGGWFRSGDLAVVHGDGYVEIKDRSKDIIISGGENISSIAVEGVLYRHAAVMEAAVVARPDDMWGETPCAFVALKPGYRVTSKAPTDATMAGVREDASSAGGSEQVVSEEDIILFCREHLPHFMAPKSVVFGPLPKTATGKIQKFQLRERAKQLGSLPWREHRSKL